MKFAPVKDPREMKRVQKVLARTSNLGWQDKALILQDCRRHTTSGVLLTEAEADLVDLFLTRVSAGMRTTALMKDMGFNIQDVKAIVEKDDRLQRLYDKAITIGRENRTFALEDEAFRRAVEGVDEPVFYKGKKVATQKRYSDPLLTTMLKAHDPDRYSDRTVVSHGGAVLHLNIEGVRGDTTPKTLINVTPGAITEEEEEDPVDDSDSPR